MHLRDLQVLRPIPTDADLLRLFWSRISTLMWFYLTLAATGAILAALAALFSWTAIGIALLTVAIATYVARRASLLDYAVAFQRRSRVQACPAPPQRPSTADDPLDLEPGARFAGRYEILALVERGRIATVYRAADAIREQRVTLYVFRPHFLPTTTDSRHALFAIAAGIFHENVLRFLDAGAHGDYPYVTTAPLPHYTLASFLEETNRRPLPPRLVAKLAGQIVRGIEAMRSHGLTHRDLAPGAVALDDRNSDALLSIVTAHTLPDYAGDATDDIRAMGMLFYDLLVGHPPTFPDPQPPIDANPNVPPDLSAIILKSLATAFHEGYPTISAFRADLERSAAAHKADPDANKAHA